MTATGAPGEVEPHGHEEAHCLLTLTPGYSSAADDAPARTSGAAAIFNPIGTYHADRFTAPGVFLSLSIDRKWMAELSGEWRLPNAPRMNERPDALARFGALVGPCIAAEADGRCDAELLAIEAIAAFAPQPRRAPPPWLRRARQLLNEESDLPRWSVRRVAAELEVTPAHLALVVRRHLGCSPGEFVHGRRARQAASLLARSRLPLAEIALRLGYADQSHFTRRFRRAYGTTPAAFRTVVG